MKNLFKIGALSLALLAAVFMLNGETNAQTAQLNLEITGESGHCTYGNLVEFGTRPWQNAAVDINTGFLTTGGDAARYCHDKEGKASWAMTLVSNEVVNANASAWNIPNTRVFVSNPTATVTTGDCTEDGGDSNGSYTALNSPVTILGKTSTLGEVCKVETSSVSIQLGLIENQAIGVYSGTLTLDVQLP